MCEHCRKLQEEVEAGKCNQCQKKMPVSTMSRIPPTTIATSPHGDGSTKIASRTPMRKSTPGGYSGVCKAGDSRPSGDSHRGDRRSPGRVTVTLRGEAR